VWGQPGPRFHQRFSATIDAQGTVIDGAWESSGDGEVWKREFAVRYRKAG
jgi:hypothetical protein